MFFEATVAKLASVSVTHEAAESCLVRTSLAVLYLPLVAALDSVPSNVDRPPHIWATWRVSLEASGVFQSDKAMERGNRPNN